MFAGSSSQGKWSQPGQVLRDVSKDLFTLSHSWLCWLFVLSFLLRGYQMAAKAPNINSSYDSI